MLLLGLWALAARAVLAQEAVLDGGTYLRAPDHQTFTIANTVLSVSSGPRIDEAGDLIPLAIERAVFEISPTASPEGRP